MRRAARVRANWLPSGVAMPWLARAGVALVLVGCGDDAAEPITSAPRPVSASSTQLEVGGASVEIPRGSEPPDAVTTRRILAAYGMAGADGLEVAIRRAPDGSLVVLQHTSQTLVARGGENVGAFLEEVLDEQLRASGISSADPRVVRRRRDGVVQRCISGLGPLRALSTCTSAYVDATGTEAALDMVRCEAPAENADTCARVLESFASAGATMPLDATLEATRVHGLPEVRADAFGWIRFGATNREFEAACQAAGARVVPPNTAGAPLVRVAAAATGRLAACEGFGPPTSLGPVELVHASFGATGGLVQAGLWVRGDSDAVGAALRRAYPDFLPDVMTTYFVNREAVGNELLAITSMPSTARPGTTLLQVYSRAGYDAPPF